MNRELLQRALDALENALGPDYELDDRPSKCVAELRAALAAPVAPAGDKPATSEPAYLSCGNGSAAYPASLVGTWPKRNREKYTVHLYTSPLDVQRDAERYRYHRSVGGKSWHRVDLPGSVLATGDVFDAATDAAMAAKVPT